MDKAYLTVRVGEQEYPVGDAEVAELRADVTRLRVGTTAAMRRLAVMLTEVAEQLEARDG